MKSKLFSLSMKDGIRSVILSMMTAIGIYLQQILSAGSMPDKSHLRNAGIAGIAAGLSYVIKNFLTNSKDEILKPEPPKP